MSLKESHKIAIGIVLTLITIIPIFYLIDVYGVLDVKQHLICSIPSFGAMLAFFLIIHLISLYLDKKGIINLKEINQEHVALQEKQRAYKVPQVVLISAFLYLGIIAGLIFIFSSYLNDDSIQDYLWLLIITYYPTALLLIPKAKKIIKSKGKKIGFYIWSCFSLALFSSNLIFAHGDAGAILVMFLMCMGFNWGQGTYLIIQRRYNRDSPN